MMSRFRFTGPLLAAMGFGVLAGCDSRETPATAPFDSVFELVERVRLEEPDSAPLTGIMDFNVAPDGRFIVVDEGRPQVRIFGPSGNLQRIVGRHGDGPGEFTEPTDAAMDRAGRLYVADDDGSEITRFHSDFTYDTTFPLPGMAAYRIDLSGPGSDRLFTVLWNEPTEPNNSFAALMTLNGELIKRIHEVDSLVWAVPYWQSFAGPVGASGRDRIVTANSFLYPIRLHDANGDPVAELGTEPPSWQQATRPERGEFVGPGSFDRLDRWLQSMTVISALGIYRDSLIVVVHARPDPSPTSLYEARDTLLDVYDMAGNKDWEDIPVPANVLRIEDHLYTLEGVPPEPWTVGVYRLARSRPD